MIIIGDDEIFVYKLVILILSHPRLPFHHPSWCGTYEKLVSIRGLYGPTLRRRVDESNIIIGPVYGQIKHRGVRKGNRLVSEKNLFRSLELSKLISL